MSKKNFFAANIRSLKKLIPLLFVCCLLLISGCYQRFEKLNVQSNSEGIIFSHPEIETAINQGNLCVFGEISVSRRDEADNLQEEMWSLQNTESGFQPTAELLKKSYILYGEKLPQTQTIIEPKPLREGIYRVSGVVGIYNQKRELLKDLSFVNKFALNQEASGSLTVSPTAEK